MIHVFFLGFFILFFVFVQAGEIVIPPFECDPEIYADCINSPNPLPDCNITFCTEDGFVAIKFRAPAERNWMICKIEVTEQRCYTPGAIIDPSPPHLFPQPPPNYTDDITMPPQENVSNQTIEPMLPIYDIYTNIKCFSNSRNPCCVASQKVNAIWKKDFSLCPQVSCDDKYADSALVCFHNCPKIYIEGNVILNETFTRCIPLIVDKLPEAMTIHWIEDRVQNITITTINYERPREIPVEQDTFLINVMLGLAILLGASFIIVKFLILRPRTIKHDEFY